MVKSGDRLLSVLWLFSTERSVLEVEEIARTLHISLSTAYRYVGQLCESGFLAPMGSLGYALGPAIIELDRQIRLADPLVQSAAPVLRRLLQDVDPAATVLLCRLYRDQVMCVAQNPGRNARIGISYERGRPMPMLRGAPSKAILAHLPSRAAERLWVAQSPELRHSQGDWKAFRAHLTKIRKAGVAVSHSEIDAGVVGVAACVFDSQGRPIGAIAAVLPEDTASPPVIARVSTLTRASADEITATLFEREASRQTQREPAPVETVRPKARAGKDNAVTA
ncbi:MAG TPA: IclR family transcriptional regulator [Caulobacteraceae bacterium]|jgi:DNA-binding IclR family transcriptional regulator|nr:IclR family transcriptional regulator [Caulobacteraceae bacterium]